MWLLIKYNNIICEMFKISVENYLVYNNAFLTYVLPTYFYGPKTYAMEECHGCE